MMATVCFARILRLALLLLSMQSWIVKGQDKIIDFESKKFKLWGCYFLTNTIMEQTKADIDNILSSIPPSDANNLNKRIIIDMMANCLKKISHEESEIIIKKAGFQEFQLADWNHLSNFDIDKYKVLSNVNLKFKEDETLLYELYKMTDKNVKKHTSGAENDKSEEKKTDVKENQAKQEPKVTTSQFALPSIVQIFYGLSLLFIMGIGLFLGYQKFVSSKKTNQSNKTEGGKGKEQSSKNKKKSR